MSIAAVTSVIGMLEPQVSWLVERKGHLGMRRAPVALAVGVFVWICGLPALFSFNRLADFRPIAGRNTFEQMDFFTANLVIPLGGFLIVVFSGWVLSSDSLRDELGLKDTVWFKRLRLVIRYVAPIAIALVFATAL